MIDIDKMLKGFTGELKLVLNVMAQMYHKA